MRRKTFYVGGMAIVGLVLLLSSVMAATAPNYAILDRFSMPYRAASMAVDSSGSIYVTSTDINGRDVFRYSSDGSYLDKVTLGSSPLSLHAGANGILYVGQMNKVEAVSGASRSTVAAVGRPVAMTSDAGILYILDANAKDVKKVDLSTNAVSSLNLSSFLTGDLTEGGIAIDGQTGELYVLDRGEAKTAPLTGQVTMVARVQVFDLSGNFIRKFSSYIDDGGKLASAKDIAVDDSGRVYLSDYLQAYDGMQGVIGVFDGNGNHLLTMPHFMMATKMQFENNKLYVVTGDSQNRRVSVVGIDKYAILGVKPNFVVLDVQGTHISGTTSLSLSNTGTDQLNWTAAVTPDWISVTPTAGSIAAAGSATADVAADATGRSAGQYYGSIDLSYDVKVRKVPVVINVYEAPSLLVAPSVVNVMAVEGGTASSSVSVAINNDLSNSMTWTASSDRSWITTTETSGPSNTATSVQLNISAAGLTAGTYTGTVTFAAPGATGNGTVAVNLTVVKKTGISVTTNNTGSTFTITDGTGAVAYSGSGLTWSASDVPAGTYTVNFNAVAGFITPNSQVKTLASGQTISFSGVYLRNQKHIVASVNRPTSTTAVRIYDVSGNLLKNIYPFKGIVGGTDTAVADVDGDGNNEIVAGVYNGASAIKVINAAGQELASAGDVYAANGVRLAAADMDGDGSAEVIAMSGNGQTDVKVLSGSLTETGAGFVAYDSRGAGGMQIAAGDVDDDGQPEIVTADVQVYTANVRIWAVDTASGNGNWTVSLKKEMTFDVAPATTMHPYRLNGLAIGNIKGSATPEIVLGFAGGRLLSVNAVTGARSSVVTNMKLNDVEVGDLNDDGNSEIIVSSGNGMISERTLSGAEIYSMEAAGWQALRISVGDLGNAGVK